MEVLAVFGQSPGVVLEPELSEDVHTKALIFARRRRRRPCRRHPTPPEEVRRDAYPSVNLAWVSLRTSEQCLSGARPPRVRELEALGERIAGIHHELVEPGDPRPAA